MKLYIEIDDSGTAQRVVVEYKTASGQRVVMDNQSTTDQPLVLPVFLVPAVNWAVAAKDAMKAAKLAEALRELGDVPEDKVAEAVAAIEGAKTPAGGSK